MTPARWLTEHAELLPQTGRALDVACGRGRQALWLADHGFSVIGIDRDRDAIDAMQREATRRGLAVTGIVADLEDGTHSFEPSAFDVILVVHYLHRPLFPALIAALRPGGLLVYETFTRRQARHGKPTNPDFLLREGELRRLVQPLDVVDYREGEFEGRDVASVVARREVTEGTEGTGTELTEGTVFTTGKRGNGGRTE